MPAPHSNTTGSTFHDIRVVNIAHIVVGIHAKQGKVNERTAPEQAVVHVGRVATIVGTFGCIRSTGRVRAKSQCETILNQLAQLLQSRGNVRLRALVCEDLIQRVQIPSAKNAPAAPKQ